MGRLWAFMRVFPALTRRKITIQWSKILTGLRCKLSNKEPGMIWRNLDILKEEVYKMSIEERVRKIVVEQLGVKEEEVTSDASFIDDLGADSLDTVELVMALEEEFETEIPDDKAESITTVKQAVDYINAAS